ncbi:hypothetical protein M2650_10095 [Luteimonas sp. SX5]|uniref:Molecular chaperone n=1 Tax=Luteimonas galliterrae TaxID=2940486 RepID=A0ABT0MK21_9GAMM|nr:hypothetical protein [Luteimonas galliterrae]MCL1634978.1 hypothetical protein [Luteimonas galliterrae]
MSRISMQAACFAFGLLASASAAAQGFSALVSPPRFEDTAKPGTTYRNVVEISNVSNTAAHYSLRTADWTLDDKAAAVFADALAPNSCRPWVGLEAAGIDVAANGKRRYRFEVAVPADAPSGECRFAILLEGDPERVASSAVPEVSGRIGIIVYLTIGDAAAQLSMLGGKADTVDGRVVPVLQIRNSGNAHGRLAGLIDGVDAQGRKFVFAPSSIPLLPGETRAISLMPEGDDPDTPAPPIAFPVQLKGRLEWGAQRLAIDTAIAQ